MDLNTGYSSLVNVGIIIAGIYGVIKAIDGISDILKKYSTKEALHKEFAEEFTKVNDKLTKHANYLENDKKHFDRVDEDLEMIKNDISQMQVTSNKQFEIIVKSLLALINYSLDNSNVGKLKDTQEELINYLTKK